MFEAAVSFIPDSFSNLTKLKLDNGPRTRVATSQSYAFRCADDKLLALHLSSPPKFWEALLKVIERPDLNDDPRFSTRDGRVRNFAALEAVLSEAFRQKERPYWVQRLQAADVPFAPVQTIPEVLADEQIRHLGTFYEDEHPTEGSLTLARRPVLIDGTREIDSKPPPTLGQHTAEVLSAVTAQGRR
jgi:formyl-CoA transferase